MQSGKEWRSESKSKMPNHFPLKGTDFPTKGKANQLVGGSWEDTPMQNAVKCSWSYSFFSLKYLRIFKLRCN